MAGCSKKQYAIMMSSGPEGEKLASKMGSMEQEEFNKAFSELLESEAAMESGEKPTKWSKEDDEDYQEFDADLEDDYGFDEDVEGIANSEEIDNKVKSMIKDGKTNIEIKNWLESNGGEDFDFYEADNYIDALRDEMGENFNSENGGIAEELKNRGFEVSKIDEKTQNIEFKNKNGESFTIKENKDLGWDVLDSNGKVVIEDLNANNKEDLDTLNDLNNDELKEYKSITDSNSSYSKGFLQDKIKDMSEQEAFDYMTSIGIDENDAHEIFNSMNTDTNNKEEKSADGKENRENLLSELTSGYQEDAIENALESAGSREEAVQMAVENYREVIKKLGLDTSKGFKKYGDDTHVADIAGRIWDAEHSDGKKEDLREYDSDSRTINDVRNRIKASSADDSEKLHQDFTNRVGRFIDSDGSDEELDSMISDLRKNMSDEDIIKKLATMFKGTIK